MNNLERWFISRNWFVIIASIVVAIGFVLPRKTTYLPGGLAFTSYGYAVASSGLSDQYAHLHWVYYLPITMALVCGTLSLIFSKRHSPRSISFFQVVLAFIGLLPFVVLFCVEIKWLNQWDMSYIEPRLGFWTTVIGLLGILFGLWKNLTSLKASEKSNTEIKANL